MQFHNFECALSSIYFVMNDSQTYNFVNDIKKLNVLVETIINLNLEKRAKKILCLIEKQKLIELPNI